MSSRRSFLTQSLALGTALLPLSAVVDDENAISEQADQLPSLQGKKILFTYGGWDGHEPTKFRDYMVPWLKSEGAEAIAHDTLDPYADQSLMNSLDLVVQLFTMAQITKEQEKGLLTAIENGAGMAGWHGGMGDSFRNNPDYQFMTGGQFVIHPGGVIDYDVKIYNKKDEITKGLTDFKMKSEQYYMHVDPNIKVLATTKFSGKHNSWIDGCTMPVAWKKMHGKGRVFYTSLGHNLNHITEVLPAMEMLKRGIRWASESRNGKLEKWVNPVYK
ncbi:MAG: ThuA domain-containing protein [Chitinophagaceae bacterium]|nr:ThuA domain-containing protein [Chitinophagaceae bacterium]